MQEILKLSDKSFVLLLISVIFFLSTAKLTQPNPIHRSDYLPPPAILKNLSAGLNIQTADSFWLRATQDFDFCDQLINENDCKGKSWLYQVVNIATDLDPKFIEAYFYGGLALTILINDFEGASKIFDKGVSAYPDDWHLTYAAAYHALYEEKNKNKASKLYLMAAEKGAPSWTRVLAGRLAKEGGDKEFSKLILQQMIASSEDPILIDRLKKKLSEVK